MDLSTVKEQLVSGCYDDPKDLNKDLKLIFQNSKIYNTDKRSTIFGMTVRLQALVGEQMKKILNNYKQEQARQESKKRRSGKLANGRSGRRKLEHNSSAEAQPSTSRYATRNEPSTSGQYTNGHDRPSTSRGQSSRHEVVNSNDEDYQPSGHLRYGRTESRPLQGSTTGRPRRQVKPVTSYPDEELTDPEEESKEEVPFDVIDEETELDEATEDDEQTEEQSEEEESPRRKRRNLTNGNRQSIKRKKGGRRSKRANKKIKLTNGGPFKGEWDRYKWSS